MRQVHVSYNNKTELWKVVDVSDGSTIEEVEDVLLFNPIYKRYNIIRGWNGILSETINPEVIRLVGQHFSDLHYIPKKYYPRTIGQDTIVKAGQMVWLRGKQMRFRFGKLNEYLLNRYVEEWQDEEIEDNEEE